MSNPLVRESHPLTWQDVRRLADRIEVKANLAGKELRDRWQAFRPRLAKFEKDVGATGARASKAFSKELKDLGDALKKLIEDLDHGA
jgi:hypothetical protein